MVVCHFAPRNKSQPHEITRSKSNHFALAPLLNSVHCETFGSDDCGESRFMQIPEWEPFLCTSGEQLNIHVFLQRGVQSLHCGWGPNCEPVILALNKLAIWTVHHAGFLMLKHTLQIQSIEKQLVGSRSHNDVVSAPCRIWRLLKHHANSFLMSAQHVKVATPGKSALVYLLLEPARQHRSVCLLVNSTPCLIEQGPAPILQCSPAIHTVDFHNVAKLFRPCQRLVLQLGRHDC
jgi:hypothetical protein